MICKRFATNVLTESLPSTSLPLLVRMLVTWHQLTFPMVIWLEAGLEVHACSAAVLLYQVAV